jgi:hypothetical protein
VRAEAPYTLIEGDGIMNRSIGLVALAAISLFPMSSAAAQTAAEVQPKGIVRAAGVVMQSACADGFQMTLATDTNTLHLRAKSAADLKISAPAKGSSSFNPCSVLKGERVAVQYKPDAASSRNGAIETLTLLPPENSSASAKAPSATPAPDAENTAAPIGNVVLAAAPGDQTTMDGKVTDVACTGNELQIKFAVAGGQVILHARDYTRVTFDDERKAFESRDFPACEQLKGRQASITFAVVEHKPYSGEMQSVEIEK